MSTSGLTRASVFMKAHKDEYSKKAGQASWVTDIAKGWNHSRCFTKSLRFSRTYGAQGDAKRLRLPSARGPNSVLP